MKGKEDTVVTSGQIKSLKYMTANALIAALANTRLSREQVQRVIEIHGSEFADLVRDAIANALKSALGETSVASAQASAVSNQLVDEKAESNYAYPPEYKGPKPIEDQIRAIAKIFNLVPTKALEYAQHLPALPSGAEGWFAVPSVDALAKKRFPEVEDPAEKYCRAVQFAFDKINSSRECYSWYDVPIDKEHLRITDRTARFMESIAQTQSGDVLIIAAQLGLRHRNRSVNLARNLFQTNEYGITTLSVLSIVLVHPERFASSEGLDIDCSGDEYCPFGEVDFLHSPCLGSSGCELDFCAPDCDSWNEFYGSGSVFDA